MALEYNITVNMVVSQDDIDNIVDSAVNWCSYWCDLLAVETKPEKGVQYTAMSEIVTRGGSLLFHIDEAFDDKDEHDYILTIEKLLKGIEDYGEYDFDNIDGPMADAIVQQALFGEVVYG